MIVFFAVTMIYRLYVKAAVVLYLPLLLINIPDRVRLRQRTSAEGKHDGSGRKAAIQSAIAGVALVGLIGLDARPELQTALDDALFDGQFLAIWRSGRRQERRCGFPRAFCHC